MSVDYTIVTEIAGDKVTQEQIFRLCNRYYWAGSHCRNKDVVEVACGTGQGVGYLAKIAKGIEAGDYSDAILSLARKHYGKRFKFQQFDAMDLPFEESSKDVIIMFEAIYYILQAEKFVQECKRVLRPAGKVLIATANKDLFDFNPSPYSYRYYGVVELRELFTKYGFKTDFFGDTPVNKASMIQRVLRPVKKTAVTLNLIPKTMGAKKFLKRIVFGKLVEMPAEIATETSPYVEPTKIPSNKPDTVHKVIYCSATLD